MFISYPLYHAVNPPTAYAFVVSKIASQAVKQAAKVPIRDITKDIAFEMAMQAIAQNYSAGSQYKFDENYLGYCVTEVKSDGSCSQLMQIKKDLTTDDMQKIDKQVDVELEKTINGGKGFSKWQKFLDWILPVWATSFGATAVTMALDPNARSLFNEVGYNTLVSLGIIKEVETTTPKTPEELESEPDLPVGNDDTPDKETSTQTRTAFSKNGLVAVNDLNYTMKNMLIKSTYSADRPVDFLEYRLNVNTISGSTLITKNIAEFREDFYGKGIEMSVSLNGQTLITIPATVSSGKSVYSYGQAQPQIQEALLKSPKSIYVRMPYERNSFLYTDIFFITQQNEVLIFQQKATTTINIDMPISAISTTYATNTSGNHTMTTTVYNNAKIYTSILPPVYEELEQLEMQGEPVSLPQSTTPTPYEDADGNMAFIPADSITFEEETTGDRVERIPNLTDDGYTWQKEDGTIVPEENVQVPPDWEPNINTTPEGVPQITPDPKPNNPNPEPIPITPTVPTNPDPDIPPQNPPPPIETTEPVFPEGENCQEGLKFPRLSPFLSAMENNFPLSIPFDIRNAFNAAFGEIGDKKPEWTFKLRDAEFKIAPPAFFDTFKPFTDSLLRFIFSIGMIYAIMRIMKGMN